MARRVRVINARDFVCARPDGVLDAAESEALLRAVIGASEPLEAFDILLDTRDAASKLSATDLWYIAERLVHRFPKICNGRTAILCPNERFDHATFFALCAERKGVDMEAFTSYEDAMEWLTATRAVERP